jgi:stringent starvation protein B
MILSTQDVPSTRPYLIRALHEWCTDNGFSPYIAVQVDASVQVPMEFVKNGEIVLNVSADATGALRLGNDFVEFKARFGGIPRDIVVPIDHVIAIYARENGQGMAFPAPPPKGAPPMGEAKPGLASVEARAPVRAPGLHAVHRDDVAEDASPEPSDSEPQPPDGPSRGPKLRRVK